jgi:hypothetical protein
MKVTIEELKGLDVEAYISWLTAETNNMHAASLAIPFLQKKIYKIALSDLKWLAYFNVVKPINANIERYKQYKKLSQNRLEEVTAKIKELENHLGQASSLASAESNIEVIKGYEINKEKPISEALGRTEVDKPKEAKTLTNEDFKKLEEYSKMFLNSDYTPAESINLRLAKTINFDEVVSNAYHFRRIFESYLQYDLSTFERMQKINNNAAQTVLKEATNTEFKFVDFIQKATFCREFFYNIEVIREFATIAYYSYVAKEDLSSKDLSNRNISCNENLTCAEKLKLLEAIGVFELPFFSISPINATKTKESQYKLLADILNESHRHIRGNLLAIRDSSTKPPYNPNSDQIKAKIDKYLNGLR